MNLGTGAILKSVINDPNTEAKIGACLCAEFCLGMLILDCSHCFGKRTWLCLLKGSILHGNHI